MQGKKALYLSLALLLPVGVFVFLKIFGKNEFEVPALYQTAVPVVSPSCGGNYQAPYKIPDSVMTRLSSHKRAALYVIYYTDEIQSRITQEITYDEVAFINSKTLGVNNSLKECVLLIPGDEDLVVVDSEGKIRGYYASDDREEVDRLLLEVEILLKKY